MKTLVFPISTRVDITVYQHGKCFIFLKYQPLILVIKLSIKFTSCQASYHVIHVILKQDHIRQS